MISLWNGLKIAFSMYSKIPTPGSDWTRDNMRYTMCFFPLVGVAIGLIFYGWQALGSHFMLTTGDASLFYGAVLVLIPVAITGGIHLDGFLDTSDALSSWQPMEKRLEILKDSRSGAFAVIMGCSYFLLSFGVYHSLENQQIFGITCITFVLSRAMSGLAIVKFKMAKNTGLAHTFSDGAQKQTVGVCMCIYILVAAIAMLLVSPLYGIIALATAGGVFGFYHHCAYKNFGGITGDLAGWFLQICELAVPFVMVLASYFLN